MRRPGVIPPGKAGIFLLAAALVPLALKEAKPLVRAMGRGLKNLGDKVDKWATSSEAEVAAEPTVEESAAEPSAAKPKKASGKKKKDAPPQG